MADYTMKKSEIIIFFHIGKTGGTTLASILRKNTPPESYFHANVVEHTPSLLGLQRMEPIIEAIKNLSERQKQAITIASGHVPFGLHQHMPRAAAYITLLREPVDRFISSIYYSFTVNKAHRYETLKHLIHSRQVPSDYQTRVVSGLTELDPDYDPKDTRYYVPVPEKALESAKRNIQEYFCIAGTIERFDEFLILLKRKLQLKLTDLLYIRENITRGRPRVSEIPEDVRHIIQENNRLDSELYSFVEQRFQNQVQQEGPSFQIELNVFQVLNQLYRNCLPHRKAL